MFVPAARAPRQTADIETTQPVEDGECDLMQGLQQPFCPHFTLAGYLLDSGDRYI
jgi:hypothetical protein